MAPFVQRVALSVTLIALLLAPLRASAQQVEGTVAAARTPTLVVLQVEIDGAERATITVEDRGLVSYGERMSGQWLGIVPAVTDHAGGDVEFLLLTDEGRRWHLPEIPVGGGRLDEAAGPGDRRLAGKVGFESVVSVGSRAVEISVLELRSAEPQLGTRASAEQAMSPRCAVICGSTRATGVMVSMPCGSCSIPMYQPAARR